MGKTLLVLLLAINSAVAFGQASCADAANYFLREDWLRARRDTAVARLLQATARGLDVLPDGERSLFIQREGRLVDSARTECRARFEGLGSDLRIRLMECVTNFSDARTKALVSALLRANANLGQRVCLPYEPDSVTVTGVLEQKTFPDLPNYRSVAEGDQAETGFYLRASTPFCISRRIDLDHPPMAGVELVQLWPRDADNEWFRAHVGQLLTVHGTLFPAVTVHHHTDVLLSAARP